MYINYKCDFYECEFKQKNSSNVMVILLVVGFCLLATTFTLVALRWWRRVSVTREPTTYMVVVDVGDVHSSIADTFSVVRFPFDVETRFEDEYHTWFLSAPICGSSHRTDIVLYAELGWRFHQILHLL